MRFRLSLDNKDNFTTKQFVFLKLHSSMTFENKICCVALEQCGERNGRRFFQLCSLFKIKNLEKNHKAFKNIQVNPILED